MMIERMRIACWITKATDIHSQYVILVACPLQRWLHERASVLLYRYMACLVQNDKFHQSALYSKCYSAQLNSLDIFHHKPPIRLNSRWAETKGRGNISGSEIYRAERRQLVTISRDRNLPFNDVMVRTVGIFLPFSNGICNVNTIATVTLASKADEGTPSEKKALTLKKDSVGPDNAGLS